MTPDATKVLEIPNIIQIAAITVSVLLALFTLYVQNTNAKKVKFLESSLEKVKFEHNTTFVKLHERRADVIVELYRKIVVIEIWMNHIVAESLLPDEVFTSPRGFQKSFEPSIGKCSLLLQDLAVYFNLNRIYLDRKVADEFVQFSNIAIRDSGPIYRFFYKRFSNEVLKSKAQKRENLLKDLEIQAQRFLNEIARIRKSLEVQIRNTLGVVESLQTEDKGNDLMWIPDPRVFELYPDLVKSKLGKD